MTTATVTVGCKFPNGLMLELGKPGVSEGPHAYRRVFLKGANTALIQNVAGGYGLTEVDADFWEAWKKKFQHLSAIRDGHVFAQADVASAQAMAIEHEKERTGMEPLDPNALPREDPEAHNVLTADKAHLMKQGRDMAQLRQGRGVIATA